MKKIIHSIIKNIPKQFRKQITQGALLCPESMPNIIFKTAESIDEVKQAMNVLHDSYVQAGFMDPNQDRLRIVPQFFLPSTAILIAKEGDTVIGTMSMIRDNSMGLPMEKIFNLSELRKKGHRLTEVSSLAIHPDYRKKGGLIFHQFIRYAWNFSLNLHGGELFVIAINPSMVQFYEDLYLFDQLPKASLIENYDFVKGAPAVGLFTKVDAREKFLKEYSNRKPEKNLYEFMFGEHSRNGFSFSNQEFFDINNFSGQDEILQYFLDSHSEWWNTLSLQDKQKFIRCQKAIGREYIKYPDLHMIPVSRNTPRFDSQLAVFSNQSQNAIIHDISEDGVKIRNFNLNQNGSSVLIACQVGPEKLVRLKLEAKWSKENFNGYKIVDADDEWLRFVEHVNLKINTMSAAKQSAKNKKTA